MTGLGLSIHSRRTENPNSRGLWERPKSLPYWKALDTPVRMFRFITLTHRSAAPPESTPPISRSSQAETEEVSTERKQRSCAEFSQRGSLTIGFGVLKPIIKWTLIQNELNTACSDRWAAGGRVHDIDIDPEGKTRLTGEKGRGDDFSETSKGLKLHVGWVYIGLHASTKAYCDASQAGWLKQGWPADKIQESCLILGNFMHV